MTSFKTDLYHVMHMLEVPSGWHLVSRPPNLYPTPPRHSIQDSQRGKPVQLQFSAVPTMVLWLPLGAWQLASAHRHLRGFCHLSGESGPALLRQLSKVLYHLVACTRPSKGLSPNLGDIISLSSLPFFGNSPSVPGYTSESSSHLYSYSKISAL